MKAKSAGNRTVGGVVAPVALMPSEGIFYAVRFPERWEPVTLRFREAEEAGHPDFWRRHVVARLAAAWSKVLRRTAASLESELRLCEYGFPRGRVVRQGARFRVFHGNDLERYMKVTKAAIEGCFGIVGLARWEEDDHEHCLREDKESTRQILYLQENWKHTDL
jgi:hypothetical protein